MSVGSTSVSFRVATDSFAPSMRLGNFSATDPGSSDVGQAVSRGLYDITRSPDPAPSRRIIDFAEMSLEEAAAWPQALKIVRERVKPIRDDHKKARERDQWWRFSRTVRDLFDSSSAPLPDALLPARLRPSGSAWSRPSRGVGCPATRRVSSRSMMTSRWEFQLVIHSRWATDVSTKLETRPRYTVASFATFPFPTCRTIRLVLSLAKCSLSAPRFVVIAKSG